MIAGNEEAAAMSEEQLRSFATRWLEAWNSHDTEQLLPLMDPDIEWDDTVFWPTVIHGTHELRRYIDAIWMAMPDVSFEDVQTFTSPADGRALCLFRQSGSAPARFGVDKSFSTYGCDIFLAFNNGKLARYLAQYEITEMMRQYDALPPRNGMLGGSYLTSLLSATR